MCIQHECICKNEIPPSLPTYLPACVDAPPISSSSPTPPLSPYLPTHPPTHPPTYLPTYAAPSVSFCLPPSSHSSSSHSLILPPLPPPPTPPLPPSLSLSLSLPPRYPGRISESDIRVGFPVPASPASICGQRGSLVNLPRRSRGHGDGHGKVHGKGHGDGHGASIAATVTVAVTVVTVTRTGM